MTVDNLEECDLGYALNKMQKTCRLIRVCFLGATVIFSVLWIVFVASALIAWLFFNQGVTSELIYVGTGGLFIVLILWNLMRLFDEVNRGNPPFSERQADILRSIAIIAFSYVLLDVLLSFGFMYKPIPELGFGMVANDGVSEPTRNLNIGMLAFSAIMYSLSAIFRYAALLQQLSDETV